MKSSTEALRALEQTDPAELLRRDVQRRDEPPPGAAVGSGQIRVDARSTALELPDGAMRPFCVAASCLLQPEPGDLVAWFRDQEGRLFVTAVLVRAGTTSVRVELGRDAIITARGSLSIGCLGALRLDGADVSLTASEKLGVQARAFDVVAGTVKVVGRAMSSVFDRVLGVSKHHQRVVEGTDHVQAQVIDYRGKTAAIVDSEHTVVSGQRIAKVRGPQIHMG